MPDRDSGKCVHHDGIHQGIEHIKGDTKTILEKLEAGAIQFAKHSLRIGILEKIVYSAVGILLLAAGALAIKSLVNGG